MNPIYERSRKEIALHSDFPDLSAEGPLQGGPSGHIRTTATAAKAATAPEPTDSDSNFNAHSDSTGHAEAVLTDWMQRYGDRVLRTAFLLLRDRHLAEDISQETFLIAYRKQNELRDTAKVSSWLTQIAVNLCRDKMRRAAWKRLVFRDRVDDLLITPVMGPETTGTLWASSLTQQVQQLPYKYREVIILFYYEMLSISDIAELLQESPGTIKSKLSRARRRLRDALIEEEKNDA